MIKCRLITMKFFNVCCLLFLLLFSQLHLHCECSEFPERECCDPIYPLIPDPEPLPPALPTTTITSLSSSSSFASSSLANPTGRSGPNVKIAIAILNCILARQLCFEDPSCSAILEIIPRVCGPVPVACSTVTVTKCQAALRTLQAFPFFRPTCLCKEPGIDPDCNYFRDFLFDHPCGFVLKKEKDPYPVDALPTCNHALSVCQQERKCIKLFEDFKQHCKVRDNKCRMEDRDACHEAWTNLRLSPMFGCICPNNHMKRRCDKIFSVVNHNPCVDILPTALDHSSGTATNSINSNYIPNPEWIDEPRPASRYPYTYPYFLFPPSHKIPLALASHRPATSDINAHYIAPALYNHTSNSFSGHGGNDHDLNASTNTHTMHFNNTYLMHKFQHTKHTTDNVRHFNDINNNNINNNNNNNNNHNNAHQHHHHQQNHNSNDGNDGHNNNNNNNNNNHSIITSDQHHINQHDLRKLQLEIVRTMGMDENYHKLLDENMVLIDTPLIAPSNSYFRQHYKTALYPYNITAPTMSHHDPNYNLNGIYSSSSSSTMEQDLLLHGINDNEDYKQNADDIDTDPESHPIHFQSTCHIALDACREEPTCSSSLKPVIMHCDIDRCNRNSCMESLQTFYRDGAHEDISLDAALCLCRKTPSRHDACMLAKEKLHPVCAQRPPDSTSTQSTTGVAYNPLPACNTVAETCKKEDPECRVRLELYEQSCAVDSVTKKCAGKTSSCRLALLGIMGTPLRTLCACQGSDLQQLYECLGWQRLLWLNPCVVESQKDFHLKRLAEMGLLITTTTTTTSRPTTQRLTTTTTTTHLPTRYTTKERLLTPPPQLAAPEITHYQPTEQQTDNDNYIELPDPVLQNELLDNDNNADDDEFFGNIGSGVTTEPTDNEQTTMVITTTTVETTTIPIRYCIVQRPHQADQYIAEGKSRRLYIMDDVECSELCSCGADTLALSCHALCVPLAPCRTSLAYYSHAAPAYQAFRGRCLCYSGRFICMRPPPGEYKLPGGIFLLLGYSSTDEALLRPHTNLGVQDAVRALQQYVIQHINNHTACALQLFNITDENIILSVRLPYDQKTNAMELLRKEKQQCTSILETISHQINTQYNELSAHRLLSIFKMAEVQIIWPEVSGASHNNNHNNVHHYVVTLLSILWCRVLFSHQLTMIYAGNT